MNSVIESKSTQYTWFVTIAILALALTVSGCSLTKSPASDADGLSDDSSASADADLGEVDSDVEVVKEDVYGKDLDFAERYPGSLRSYYESYETETTVTYQTTDTVQKVREFYTKKLQDGGWKLEGDGTDFTEFSRTTPEKGNEYLSVYYYDYQATQGIIEFELYLEQLGDDSSDEEA